MLDEQKLRQVRELNLGDDIIEQIDDYDDARQIVTFKDGSEHQVVECYCRCMGYIKATSQYNKGKQSEFNERKWFVEAKALNNEKNKQEA